MSNTAGADLGGGCRGCAPPPPSPEMTCGFLIQLVFWFIGVEFEQETSAPPPKKNPGSAPVQVCDLLHVKSGFGSTRFKIAKHTRIVLMES